MIEMLLLGALLMAAVVYGSRCAVAAYRAGVADAHRILTGKDTGFKAPNEDDGVWESLKELGRRRRHPEKGTATDKFDGTEVPSFEEAWDPNA